MVASERVVMYFEANAEFVGTHDEQAQRWKMIVDVLKALGCHDIILRETDFPDRAHAPSRAADGGGLEDGQ